MIKYQTMEKKPHLYIIHIAHSYADMGSLRDENPVDEQYEAMVKGFWVGIFHYLNNWSPDLLVGLQIYQDSLVNAPLEIVDKIVDEIQSPNYDILRQLRRKGAIIFGTEDPSPLMEEYRALKAIANCTDREAKTTARLEYFKKSTLLLKKRDKYIAQRIRETLPEGKTGLLFIGAAHDVSSLLSNEIHVSTPEIVSHALPKVLRDLYSLRRERK